MIDWDKINTVLLDMDGTLLDLHYDNYFWQHLLPGKWAEMHNLTFDEAKSELMPVLYEKKGTLNWYCIDYWSTRLEIDIMELKSEIEHKIKTRPYARELLKMLEDKNKSVLMVTNAHQKLLTVKMEKTGLAGFFEKIISAHDIGVEKESIRFWESICITHKFDPGSTVLIDDNHEVLRAARQFGIKHIFTISTPDSQRPPRNSGEFTTIDSFNQVI